MERNVTSILGFQTQSISPKSIAQDMQMLKMPKLERWKLLWQNTWDKILFFALAVYAFVFISFASVSESTSHTWILTGLFGTILALILTLFIIMVNVDKYLSSNNKLLQNIIEKYEVFNRDVWMINNDVNINYFHSEETKDKLADFLRKVQELREFEPIPPFIKGIKDGQYSRYADLLSWFMLYSLYCTEARRIP